VDQKGNDIRFLRNGAGEAHIILCGSCRPCIFLKYRFKFEKILLILKRYFFSYSGDVYRPNQEVKMAVMGYL